MKFGLIRMENGDLYVFAVEKDKDLLPVPGIEIHFLGCPVQLELIGSSLKK